MDWNFPYSCQEWAKNFKLTYPLIDDSEGKSVYNFFSDGTVPYNVVIDRNGKLIYSKSGFDKDEIINAIKNGLKVPKTEFLQVDKRIFDQKEVTRYQMLLNNKGIK